MKLRNHRHALEKFHELELGFRPGKVHSEKMQLEEVINLIFTYSMVTSLGTVVFWNIPSRFLPIFVNDKITFRGPKSPED
jgi:hypothetical protein